MKLYFALYLLSLYFIITLEAFVTSQTGIPYFDGTYEEMFLNEGEEGEVLCRANGEPPITYRWYDEDNNEIFSNENSTVLTRKTSYGKLLVFKSPDSGDSGVYTCTAQNAHGLDSKIFKILFISDNSTANKTDGEVSINEVKTVTITANSVLFSIQTTGPVEFFLVRYQEKVTINITRTIKFLKDEPIEVKNLVASGLYYFQFHASSAEVTNTSIWTKTYEIILLPQAPEVTFRSLNNGYLQIEWERYFSNFRRGTIDKHVLTYNLTSRSSPDEWKESECGISIEINYCSGSKYTIADLVKGQYYIIRLRAHTQAGFGESFKIKIYVA